jgi:hypothetical protein
MREIEAAAAAGDHRAALAMEMFVDRAAAWIAGLATSLPALDAVVFTGGIGEHAGRVRARIVERLVLLGLAPLDPGETESDRVLQPALPNPAWPVVSRPIPGGRRSPVAVRVEAREDVVAGVGALAALRPGTSRAQRGPAAGAGGTGSKSRSGRHSGSDVTGRVRGR